ncbi:MAG: hypothetical protein WC812_04580 [Candidatus Pacearchaeota archaeon]|jgi:hypothetical protein
MIQKTPVIILAILATIFLVASILLFFDRINLNREINSLMNDKTILSSEKESLQSNISDLQLKYNLLEQDVAEIYKSCMTQNVCKGRFPGVSWYCNNVGDEVSDYSHICICDSSCNLNATKIKN